MVNGHIFNQIAEPEFFQAGGFPLDNLESIEVIVGPGGVFYGGETLCAILNLITKKSDGNEIAASSGSGYKTNGDGALPNRDMQYMVGKSVGEDARFFASGSYYERGGYEAWRGNSANSSNANLAKLDDVTGRVFPSYNMFIGSDFNNWSGQFFSQNSQMPEMHDVSAGVKDARRTDYIYSAGIKNKTAWDGGWSTSLELYGDLKRMLRAVIKVGPDASGDIPGWDLSQTAYSGEFAVQHDIPGKNIFQLGFQGAEKQNRHNYDFEWDPDRPYTFYSYKYDSLGKVMDSTRLDKMRAIVNPSETHTVGMYVSDKFTINPYLKVIAAMRMDRDDVLDDSNAIFFDADKLYFSPRLALIATPTSRLTLKMMYNRATRLAQSPWGTSLNHLWGVGQKGLAPDWATQNATISRPEILNTLEAQSIYYALDSRITVNYWHQQLDDFTSWFSPWTNVGNFTGNGFEYEIMSHLSPMVSLWTNGAFSDNNFEIVADSRKSGSGTEAGSAFQLPSNDKGEVMGVPKFTANFGADLLFMSKLSISPTIRYLTRQVMAEPTNVTRKTATGADTTVVDFKYGYADNRIFMDLTTMYENIPIPRTSMKMDIRMIFKNLFNETDLLGNQWMVDSYHPQGLTWEAGVFIRF
jgi:outer membrane receptor protein involved in Fe transport